MKFKLQFGDEWELARYKYKGTDYYTTCFIRWVSKLPVK